MVNQKQRYLKSIMYTMVNQKTKIVKIMYTMVNQKTKIVKINNVYNC